MTDTLPRSASDKSGGLGMSSPVLAVLQVSERGQHDLHPDHIGAEVSGVLEVIVPQRLLELFRHLLKVGEVTGALHDTRSSTIYTHFFKSKSEKADERSIASNVVCNRWLTM